MPVLIVYGWPAAASWGNAAGGAVIWRLVPDCFWAIYLFWGTAVARVVASTAHHADG